MDAITLLKAFVGGGGTPEQFLTQKLLGNVSNPMVNNLFNMAKSGNKESVENFARNIFNERGRDFDKEFSDFMNQLKK